MGKAVEVLFFQVRYGTRLARYAGRTVARQLSGVASRDALVEQWQHRWKEEVDSQLDEAVSSNDEARAEEMADLKACMEACAPDCAAQYDRLEQMFSQPPPDDLLKSILDCRDARKGRAGGS